MKLSTEANAIICGVGLALALLILIGIESYRSTTSLVEITNQVALSRAVLHKREELLSILKDAEIAERDFLISADVSSLSPHFAALADIESSKQDLRGLLSGSVAPLQKLDVLAWLIAKRLTELGERIELRALGGLEVVAQAMQNQEGRLITEQISRVADEMEDDENKLLERRTKEADATARRTIVTVVLGSCSAFVLVGIASFFIYTELSRRKRAEAILRISETKFRSLVEQIPAVTYSVALDRGGATLYISPQIEGILGFSPQAWSASPQLRVKQLHPQDRQRVLAEIHRSRSRGEPLRSEYRMLAHDGRVVWLRDEAVVVRDAANEPLFLQGLMMDISEQRLAADRIHAYEDQLRSLAAKLSLVEEQERQRIATDLHDHISQALAIAQIKLDALQALSGFDGLAEPVSEIRQLLEQAIGYTRSLTFELSPPALYELGFEAAVEGLTEQIMNDHGIAVYFKYDGQTQPVNDTILIFLYKAVRELLINVVKHAQARRATVSIQGNADHIRIVVEDDGIGFSTVEKSSSFGKGGGFGLFNLRERLKHVGGHFDIESSLGHGTRVTLVSPSGLNI
jgi:two-component system sensor histidine kinase UhpB